MPNTLYWNSVTGQWNAASFGGTLPVVGDTGYADGRVKTPFLTSLDRSADVYATERVTNGDFSVGTGWTLGAGWSIGAGIASAAAGDNSSISQAGILVLGRSYQVTYTVSGRTAGTIQAYAGSTGAGTVRSTNATFVENIVCAGDTTLWFQKNATFDGDIDNVSVVESPGLDLAKFETTELFLGDIGTVDQPLKLAADLFIHRGLGKLHLTPAHSNGLGIDRLIIDTPNVSHEIQLPTALIPEIALHRGKARFTGTASRIFIGHGSNAQRDAYLTTTYPGVCANWAQYGGTHLYAGQYVAAGGIYVLSEGYCQFDGRHVTFIQTGGHCDFGVASAVSGPYIDTAWLIDGSMDATKAALGQAIGTAYISPSFELIEDEKLTITTRKNLWE